MRTCLFCFAFRSPLLNDQVLGPGRPPHIRHPSPTSPSLRPDAEISRIQLCRLHRRGCSSKCKCNTSFQRCLQIWKKNHGSVSNWSLSYKFHILTMKWWIVTCFTTRLCNRETSLPRWEIFGSVWYWRAGDISETDTDKDIDIDIGSVWYWIPPYWQQQRGWGHFWDGSRWR